MDLARKVEIAKKSIESIARHDDEHAARVRTSCDEVAAHIEAELTAMDERRAEREKQTVTAANVGSITNVLKANEGA